MKVRNLNLLAYGLPKKFSLPPRYSFACIIHFLSFKWNKLLLIPAFLFLSHHSNAQYNEIGFLVGGSNYKGELSRHLFNTDFIHPAAGFFYRHNWNRHWSWKLEINYGRISGNDSFAETPFELDRNLSFYSNVLDVSPLIEFNFLPFETGRIDYPFTPYLFTGISFFYFNPKAELAGNNFELQPLGTEGQGINGKKYYKRFQVAIPIGGGIKVSLGRLGIGLQVGARRTYSDYLDDVSTTYPDMNTLLTGSGPVAVALSDRSFSRLDTTVTIPYVYMKQRGNSTDKDWYVFAGITFFWRLSHPLSDICQPFKRRRY